MHRHSRGLMRDLLGARGSAITCASYGEITRARRPFSSSRCSTTAAMIAARADAVAALDERLLDAVLVEERRVERLRVAACRT